MSTLSQSTEQSKSEIEIDPEDEIKGEDDQSETESPGDGRLYMGNLPYAMTSTQLGEVFGEAGSVLSVEIVYDRVTNRSRVFAFVTMASVEDAKVAIQMFDGSMRLFLNSKRMNGSGVNELLKKLDGYASIGRSDVVLIDIGR